MKRLLWVAAAAAAMISSPSLADGVDHGISHGFFGGMRFEATASAAQEVHRPDSKAIGHATIWFDKALSQVFVDVRVHGLVGTFAGAHFHCNRAGANGPVALGLQNPGPLTFDGKGLRGVLTNDDVGGMGCADAIGRPVNNIASLAFAMRDGLIYLNVHSDFSPPGEIRGQVVGRDKKWF